MDRFVILLVILWLAPACATAGGRIGFSSSPTRDQEHFGKRVGTTGPCDSDVDGAVIGTLIGITPGVLGLLGEEGEAREIQIVLMGMGGIVGFWAGLAIDSLDCDEAASE